VLRRLCSSRVKRPLIEPDIVAGRVGTRVPMLPNRGLARIKGTVSQQLGATTLTRDVDLLVPDAKIHSGVPRTSPCDNISSESYVLQGGSPTGCESGLATLEELPNGLGV
jgi:hypothetical protein